MQIMTNASSDTVHFINNFLLNFSSITYIPYDYDRLKITGANRAAMRGYRAGIDYVLLVPR